MVYVCFVIKIKYQQKISSVVIRFLVNNVKEIYLMLHVCYVNKANHSKI
jgi:hypothetical protein